MIVNSTSLIDDLVGWWMSRRASTPVIRVGTRVEPAFDTPTPLSDTPAKVSGRRHQSPSHFAVSANWTDTWGQTDFPLIQDGALPDPMIYRNDPEPTPPRPRRKRSARNEKAARWIRSQALKNGGVPAFKLILNTTGVPKATASRLRREVIAELGVA